MTNRHVLWFMVAWVVVGAYAAAALLGFGRGVPVVGWIFLRRFALPLCYGAALLLRSMTRQIQLDALNDRLARSVGAESDTGDRP